MGYDRGNSFPFEFESNGIPFGSERKKKRKLLPRLDPIQFEGKWKYSFLSVGSNTRTRKTTAIRLIAVREAGVSRHHGGQ